MIVYIAKEHRIIFKTAYFVTKNNSARAVSLDMAVGFIWKIKNPPEPIGSGGFF